MTKDQLKENIDELAALELLKLGELIVPVNSHVDSLREAFHELTDDEQDDVIGHLDFITKDIQTRPPIRRPR